MEVKQEERKELRNLSICIVLSYFSIGMRIVQYCIIAFMANKRKDVPVRPVRWSSSATIVPSIPKPFHRSATFKPLVYKTTSVRYCHRVVRSSKVSRLVSCLQGIQSGDSPTQLTVRLPFGTLDTKNNIEKIVSESL